MTVTQSPSDTLVGYGFDLVAAAASAITYTGYDDGQNRTYPQGKMVGWRAAAIAKGDEGIQAPFVRFRPNDWDTHPHQPAHPRIEKSGVQFGSDQGTEAQFIRFLPNDWDTHPHQPQHPRPEREAALVGSDQGTQSQFVRFLPNDWDTHPHQPQHPRPERAGVLFGGDQGNEQFILFFPYGWEVPSPQPPHPRPERGGSIFGGDQGNEAPFIRFFAYGWEVPSPQPPHPRPERVGAIMPNEPGIEAQFVPPATAPNWGWEVQQLIRLAKARAMPEFGHQGTDAPIVFQAYGWEVPSPQPPHPRPERGGSIMIGHQGTDAPFILFQPYGWEILPPHLPRQIAQRYWAAKGRAEFAVFSPPFPEGWHIPPFQPPHPRPERNAAWMIGDQGTEALYVFVPPVTNHWGWEIAAPHLKNLVNRYPAIEGAADFAAFTFQPYGWEIPYQHVPRPSTWRAAAVFVGSTQGTEFPFVQFLPYGWFIPPPNPVQPPPVGPNRAAAVTWGDQGIQYPLVVNPRGWDIPPPHLTRMVANRHWAAKGRAEFAVFSPPFPEGWHIPPFQPPHPRPERGGAIMPWEAGIEAQFVFIPPAAFPEGWQIPPPHLTRTVANRYWATKGRAEFAVFTPWLNMGWEIPPFQPPFPKTMLYAAIFTGDQGTYAPFVFVPPPTPTATDWIDFYRRARRR